MSMQFMVRLECDKCLSHRDLWFGDVDADGISPGISMLVRYRAAKIGWRIHMTNAQKLCRCERCKNDFQ
jgi:hypothetical protein